MSGVMLMDMNGIGHANNAASKLTVGDYQVQAIFGSLNSIRELKLKNANLKPIGLWDGRAQWRYDLYPEYKGKRKLDPNAKPKPYQVKAEEQRQAYRLQRDDIVHGLELLGVTQVIPKHDEADDLAGFLSRRYSSAGKEVLLVARDHDWLQLVNKNTSWFNPVDDVTVNHASFCEYTGYETSLQFVQEKALIGDSSDCIKGVAGIGEKAAQLILNHYGSVEALHLAAKDGDWEPPIKELSRYRKKINEFVGQEKTEQLDIFKRNMKLMNLLEIDKPKNIVVKKEPIDVDGFIEFCHELNFKSIINKKEQWLEPFMETE